MEFGVFCWWVGTESIKRFIEKFGIKRVLMYLRKDARSFISPHEGWFDAEIKI